jgi:hypothetical protein
VTYDPWRSLRDDHPDITLAVTRLPAGQAWWLPQDEAIVLDDRLNQAERRSALEHELQHALAGDTHCDPAVQGARRIGRRRELAADHRAAARLITLEQLADALVWCLSCEEVAEYLHVDHRTVRARILGLNADEKTYIEGRMAAKGDAA